MKKKKLLLITLFIGMFFITKPVSSNSIMGGELTWTCVGVDSFLIKLVLYRDCNAIQIGTVSIPITCNSTNQNITTVSISTPAVADITPVCDTLCTKCSNATCSFPYGIEEITYQKLVILSSAGSCCELVLSYSLYFRNYAITTGAANKNFYIDAMMNRCLNPCDNSPQFTNSPVIIACIGRDFVFNNGVNDQDKDSLGGLSDS
ncbi:MAG: hypothetical protein U9R42_14820, partial [Bacteroidota bacterium]|nr:hypothetical protein [Bacteroidota bacterium]